MDGSDNMQSQFFDAIDFSELMDLRVDYAFKKIIPISE